MLKIGLDIGYGYTKAVASNGKKIIFPSLVGEGFKRQYVGIFSGPAGNKLNVDNIHAEIDGTDYFIGKLASLESKNCSYAFDQNKIYHINTKILLATSVAMLMDRASEDISIVVGLPFSDYTSQKAQMQEYLNNFKAQVKLGDNTERLVRFNVASPFPQAAGAVFDLAESDGFPNRGLVGCVDVGTKTTDLNVFEADEMLIIESMSGTLNSGAHVIHSYLSREVERLTGSRPEIPELEKIVRNGAMIVKRGKEYNLKASLGEGKADLAKRIKDEIIKKWSHRIDDFSRVYLVGGGAGLLGSEMKDIYDETFIPEAPEMSNAKGFLIVAGELANKCRML